MKEKPIINARAKLFGRFLKCPLCRVTESNVGERSQESWKRETVELYKASNRSLSRKKIQDLETLIRQAETALRFLQEENSALLDENVHLRNLCGLVAPEEPVAPVAHVAAPVAAPVVAEEEAEAEEEAVEEVAEPVPVPKKVFKKPAAAKAK
jgi:hypothetical protein